MLIAIVGFVSFLVGLYTMYRLVKAGKVVPKKAA